MGRVDVRCGEGGGEVWGGWRCGVGRVEVRCGEVWCGEGGGEVWGGWR